MMSLTREQLRRQKRKNFLIDFIKEFRVGSFVDKEIPKEFYVENLVEKIKKRVDADQFDMDTFGSVDVSYLKQHLDDDTCNQVYQECDTYKDFQAYFDETADVIFESSVGDIPSFYSSDNVAIKWLDNHSK